MKYFLAKKKYYKTRYLFNPEIKHHSEFVRLITKGESSEHDTEYTHITVSQMRSTDMRQYERKQLREMMVSKG